jgi:hypothetical protein
MSCIVQSVEKRRHRTLVWFGTCSYRKLKVTYEVREMLCPLCQHELEDAHYLGSAEFQFNVEAIDYQRNCWMPLHEDGLVVWVVSPEKHWNH